MKENQPNKKILYEENERVKQEPFIRLNDFLNSKRVKTTELAEVLGVTYAAAASIRNGKNHPSGTTLNRLLNAFPDLCGNWLIIGAPCSDCGKYKSEGKKEVELPKDEEIRLLKELLTSKDEIIRLYKKMAK